MNDFPLLNIQTWRTIKKVYGELVFLYWVLESNSVVQGELHICVTVVAWIHHLFVWSVSHKQMKLTNDAKNWQFRCNSPIIMSMVLYSSTSGENTSHVAEKSYCLRNGRSGFDSWPPHPKRSHVFSASSPVGSCGPFPGVETREA